MPSDTVWPFVPGARNVNIAAAAGVWLTTADGRQILDAAGGAIVANVGHGRAEVAERMAAAARRNTYVVPPWLTPEREALVERLHRDWLPATHRRVHLTCGGSEAVETAMKIALQYHAARGDTARTRIIGRAVSYHGTTIATTAVGGHVARKRGLAHALPPYLVTPTPYLLRCPLGRHHPDATGYYVDALAELIASEGPGTIAAFVAEPITGSSGGAIVPPEDYWREIRALTDAHGILLIHDEVMTGFGRTGKRFAFEHWDVPADLFVAGKGLAGGYAPLAGVFARDGIAATLAEAHMNVMFHTFGALPSACAAADEVLRILTDEHLVARAAERGEHLTRRLADAFGEHPHVAEVRGRGLLQAIEVVRDRDTLEPYPIADNVTNRIVGNGLERGVFFYSGGTGEVRDIVCMGPPFIITDAEIDHMVDVLREAVDAVTG